MDAKAGGAVERPPEALSAATGSDLPEGAAAEAKTQWRARAVRGRWGAGAVVAYSLGLILVAIAGFIAWLWHAPPVAADIPGAAALLILGLISARLREVEGEEEVDLSFTSVIILSATPLCGPFSAAALGALIPFLAPRARWGVVTVFNAAMISLLGSAGALAYRVSGGVRPLPGPGTATPEDLLRHVGVPLFAADLAVVVVNALALVVMMTLSGSRSETFLVGSFLKTLPLYLGYALTSFFFVVLWGPGGVGPLTPVLILAPLLVARWAYVQYVNESRAHERILGTLAAAGRTRGGAVHKSRALASLCLLLADDLQLAPGDQRTLRYSVALQGLGSIAVPDGLFHRPGEDLTDDDLRVLAGHVETGYEVICEIDFLEDAARAVRHHHERWDGAGYPDGLAGTDIPLVARILTTANTFDALLNTPGRVGPPSPADAVDLLRRQAGTYLDPDLVAAFARVVASPEARDLVAELTANATNRRVLQLSSPEMSQRVAALPDHGRTR